MKPSIAELASTARDAAGNARNLQNLAALGVEALKTIETDLAIVRHTAGILAESLAQLGADLEKLATNGGSK